eukprot:scaffold3981_cov64-Cylindrotheca_fusiformis.AAC.2
MLKPSRTKAISPAGMANTSFSEDASPSNQTMTTLDGAASHCEELDLEPPLVTSAVETILSEPEGNAESSDHSRAPCTLVFIIRIRYGTIAHQAT